jgi:predicted MFS family arabinose efflux permease
MRLRFTGLWRNAGFMRLWIGQTISVGGSLIGRAALSFTAILVLQATPFQVGLLFASSLVPGFLTGLIAGAWVDRLPRRPILIWADIGRAALLATIPLAAVLGLLRIEQLYVVNFLVSILTIFFDVAYQSYLPSLISRTDLIEGNSKLTASASVAEVGGFALAGWLVQLCTGPITILIDAISFVVSALFVGLIRVPEQAAADDLQPDLRREIAEGLRSLLENVILRTTAVCTISQEFFLGVYSALVVLFMARDLGFAPGILGTIWALGGISSLIGAVASDPASKRFGIGPAMIAACLLSGVAMFFVPLARGATLTAALLLILQQLLGDGAATIYQINQISLRAKASPEFRAIFTRRENLADRVEGGLRMRKWYPPIRTRDGKREEPGGAKGAWIPAPGSSRIR